jgi:DNA-binding response OmpR family regulator
MIRNLIVDDDNAVLFAFKKLCAANGIATDTADTLESALELIAREKYDVVISDLNLTGACGQQGFEIVQAAKRNNPQIRTYIWTAYVDKILRDKVTEIGIDGYLTKPVTFTMLLSIITGNSKPNQSTGT